MPWETRTTAVPRFRSKAELVGAVIDSLRVADLPAAEGPPRTRALAILQNFHDNLRRMDAMSVVGTLLAEERRHPELLETFRHRLVGPRRTSLRQALADGIAAGELPPSADPEVLASMLIGSFYARYLASSDIPADWPDRTLRLVWPEQPPRVYRSFLTRFISLSMRLAGTGSFVPPTEIIVKTSVPSRVTSVFSWMVAPG